MASKKKDHYSTKFAIGCNEEGCMMHCHSVKIKNYNAISKMPQFQDMSCFEIAHHPSAAGMWISNPEYNCNQRGEKDTIKMDEKEYIQCQHLFFSSSVQRQDGLNLKKTK